MIVLPGAILLSVVVVVPVVVLAVVVVDAALAETPVTVAAVSTSSAVCSVVMVLPVSGSETKHYNLRLYFRFTFDQTKYNNISLLSLHTHCKVSEQKLLPPNAVRGFSCTQGTAKVVFKKKYKRVFHWEQLLKYELFL